MNKVNDDMKQILFDIANESSFKIEVMESEDGNHVHLLVDYPPNISVSSIVNRLKNMFMNSIWQRFPTFLSRRFWKEYTF